MKASLPAIFSLLFCAPLSAQAPKCPPSPTHIFIESGTYSSQPGVIFDLRHFSAELIPKSHFPPNCYEKITAVSHAEIIASDDSLTQVFTSKLKEGKVKIENFKVENTDDQATISGTITKVIPIKFTVSGPVDTDGSVITLHAASIKADGVPVKDLLALFGKNLTSVMKVKNVRGVTIDKDTISFDPEKLANLKGHLESARTTDKGLELRYTSGHSHAKRDATQP